MRTTVVVQTGSERKTRRETDAIVNLDPRVFRNDAAMLRIKTEVYGKPIEVRLAGEGLRAVRDSLSGVGRILHEAESEAEQFVNAQERHDMNDMRYHAGRMHGLLRSAALITNSGYDDRERNVTDEGRALIEAAREKREASMRALDAVTGRNRED